MGRRSRWMLMGLLGLGALAGILALVLAWLIPSDEELATRIAAQAQATLGVEVTVGAVHWQLFPPAVVIEQVATVQPEPISFKRLVVQPDLRALLHKRLRLEHVLIDGGVMPQMSLRRLRVQPAPAGGDIAQPMLDQLRFRNLTWVTRHGIPLEFDGNAVFDAGWRPREVLVQRPGVKPLTQLTLAREGSADRWQVKLLLGGGTAHGQVELTTGGDGALQLAGQLEPRGVEVDNAMEAFKRNSIVRGKASGRTTLSASGRTVAELARSLHTRTNFSVASATLLRFDVDKAIRTAGTDRAGQTPLQSLTGQMDTQNTPAGIVVRYSALEAKGETFSARGEGTIADRRIDAQLTVDLVGGLIGVPLKVSGPLAAPQVTIPKTALAGAAAGAAVGTVILPGIGTAIGAGVGAAIGKMFGGEEKKK